MLADGMNDAEHPVFVSTLSVTGSAITGRHPAVDADDPAGRISAQRADEARIGRLRALAARERWRN